MFFEGSQLSDSVKSGGQIYKLGLLICTFTHTVSISICIYIHIYLTYKDDFFKQSVLNLDKPQVWDPDRYFKGLTLGARYTRTSIWSTGGKKFSPISRILPTQPSFSTFHRLAPWSRLTQSVSRRIHQKEENCDPDVTGKPENFARIGKFNFGMALKVERWAVPLDVLIKSFNISSRTQWLGFSLCAADYRCRWA